jgi:hypothetical protein
MPNKTWREKLVLLDWVGTITSIGAMVTVIMCINLGGVLWAWKSGQTITLAVVSGVLWIAFAVQQSFCILTSLEQRLSPVHLLKQAMPILLGISSATVAAVSYVSVYYIPIYFQFSRGDSAIYTSVRLLPFISLLIVTIPLSGALMSRWGLYKPWYVGGSAICLITTTIMAHYINLDTNPGVFYATELFLGAGVGVYTQASFAVIQSVLPAKESANGLALMLVCKFLTHYNSSI